MRNIVAKRIRKSVYGDMSHRDVIYGKDKHGAIRATGLRKVYQEQKRKYKFKHVA